MKAVRTESDPENLVDSQTLEPKRTGERYPDSPGVRGLKGYDKTFLTTNNNNVSYIIFQCIHP